MKLLLVSDLHYALKQYDWTAAMAHQFDVVVVAGDHLDIAGQLDGGVQIVVILKYLKRLAERTKVIVSSGNHDLDTRDASGEKIAAWMNKVRLLGIPADGDSVEMGDTLVSVCPWWDGPASKEQVHALLARDAAKPKRNWIWVYHAPPEGSPTAWNGKRSFGDAALTEWIGEFRPDIVLTGHIHEAPFKPGGSWADRIGDTWVFNSGRQIGPVPTHIAIDTAAREAAWFSLAGDEMVRLDAPLERTSLSAPPNWLSSQALDRSPA
ncbi:metallophosphoesterase [alpha proteobacterium U9-1i]|nr:metallophosphoesterase [alpha proteobacterium U9-1i]